MSLADKDVDDLEGFTVSFAFLPKMAPRKLPPPPDFLDLMLSESPLMVDEEAEWLGDSLSDNPFLYTTAANVCASVSLANMNPICVA